MANLIFIDEGHKYTVDGVDVPSVSELTRFIAKDIYSTVNQLALDEAAERGTKVHKATEILDKYGTAEIQEDLVSYLKAYVQFIRDHRPDWEKIEWSVHNELLYAGTIDRYGTLDGKKVILDIKTTSNITKNHRVLYTAAQNLYRMAIEDEHPVDEIIILQLKKDGSYKVINLEVEDSLATSCMTLHEALKKKRRKSNGRDDGTETGEDGNRASEGGCADNLERFGEVEGSGNESEGAGIQ